MFGDPNESNSDYLRPSQRPWVAKISQKISFAINSESGSRKYILRFHGLSNTIHRCRPFVTAKSTVDARESKPAKAVTTTAHHGRNALWYDTLYVEVDNKEMNDEVGLLVNLVEYRNKKILAKFIIPTAKLVPGEQYNVCLVLNQEGTCLLFSVMMESFFSFNDFIFSKFADMSRLEVFLSGVVKATKQSNNGAPMTPKESVLAADPFDSAPVMAVLHIEQDIDAYLRKIKKETPQLPFQRIFLEDADAFEKVMPSYYKVSTPSLPFIFPQWNSLFEYICEAEILSQPRSGLVLELFRLDFPKKEAAQVVFSGYATIPFADVGDGEALGWAGEISQVETRLHIVSLPEDPKMAMIRANDKLIRMEESVSESDSINSRRSSRTESSRSSTLFKQPEPINGEYEDIVMNIKLELRRWSGKDFMKYLKQRAPESNSGKKLRASGASDYENTSSSSRGSLRRRDSSPAVKPVRNPNVTVLSPTKVFPDGVDYPQTRVKRGSGSSSTASTTSQPHSQDFNYEHQEQRKKRYAYPDNNMNNNNPLSTSQNVKSKRNLNYSFESNDDDDERYLSSSSTHSGHHYPLQRGHVAHTPRSQSSNHSDVMNLRESYSPISMPPSPRYPPIGVSSSYMNYTPTSTPTNAPPQPFVGQGSFQQRHLMMQGQLPPLQIPPSHNMNFNQGPPSLSTSTSASSSNTNNQNVPYQSSFEEASIEMAIEAALSKIQEMLNDSLHKKQLVIDRMRSDASQSQRLIDSLNDQLNGLTLQSNTLRLENEQLKIALRDKDQSELASFTDPNIDQLSKEELLVKYKTLLTSLSAQQMEPRTQFFQALATQRKKSQEELDELRSTRQQLHQEVRNLEDKKNKLDDDLENRTVNDALFSKLNALLTNAVKVANNQHAKQMRVDLNQQKLLQRLQEEEERNRELQVKLKNNSHEFTEALLSMQRKLLKRTKQFHEVKRQLKLLNHELTHVTHRD
eukprot:TRINITY_DN1299_c0_g1_i2.p1 TRINITY_DN1299_c0_g1~~TRINITY_DN1299_c0_g1_i2.p1  ORF type:complete len:968 (-),score=301.87 TRINITY_DN1299_c0_g1_i2:333-3236(-)